MKKKHEKPVISIRNLGKSYKITHTAKQNEHPTFKDAVVDVVRKPLRKIGAAGAYHKDTFWALRNIDLDIYKGQTVGIMGRNGSGKSTLFKILSRITSPTEGEVIIRGKTNSLLEVGTGFHPELTGRENIYFNASILGMSKNEIEKKFNQIVEFSEISKFLDTPLKFYSSGMKVRLAFSVAAHIDPDILIIDEVLAVGDARFKQKSLDKMKAVANEGKTILFVSHIVSQIEQLCNSGVLLDRGRLIYQGDLSETIDQYLELNAKDLEEDSSSNENEESDYRVDPNFTHQDEQVSVKLGQLNVSVPDRGRPPVASFDVQIRNLSPKKLEHLWMGYIISSPLTGNISLVDSERLGIKLSLDKFEKKVFKIQIEDINLNPGVYNITVGIRDARDENKVYFRKNAAYTMRIPEYEFNSIKIKRLNRIEPPVVFKYRIKVGDK